MATFDTLTEPWIPVVNREGIVEETGLRALLHRAHELRSVRDPFPTVEFGINRLLTALVLDIFKPRNTTDLQNLLQMGFFDRERVEAYLTNNRDRFDLFDSRHPFLQSSGMEKETSKPLAGLLPPIPSGTNSSHFHHLHEDDFGVSAATAARLLTTIAPFMTAGGAGLPPSINGAPVWYVWISRPESSLFEAICLNCCVLSLSQAIGNEGPSWRSARDVTNDRRSEASLLEALTWRPRRVQLEAGAPGVCSLTGRSDSIIVRTMKFTPGFASGFDPPWTDPSVPYRNGDKGTLPLRPQPGREVWRDTGPIALLRYDNSDFSRPRLVDQYTELDKNGTFSGVPRVSISLYGMRTDMKMKVFEWYAETLNLPTELLWQRSGYKQAQSAMERAEKAAFALKQAIKRAYPRDGKGNASAFETLIECAERQYWSHLRRPYELFLLAVAPLSPEDDEKEINVVVKTWEEQVRRTAWTALDEAIEDLDTDSEALKRLVEARRFFGVVLNGAFSDTTPGKKKSSQNQKAATDLTGKGE